MGYRNYDGYVGIARQTEKGSGQDPVYWFRYLTAEYNPVNEMQTIKEGGFDRQGVITLKTGMTFNITVEALVRPDMIGYLCTALMGADAKTGETAPYTHTISPATEVDYWTIEMGRLKLADSGADSIVDRLVDCKILSLTITGTAGDLIRCSFEFQGLTVTSGSTWDTITDDTELPFRFDQGVYTFLGGASTLITEFALEVVGNVEGIQTNSITYDQLVEGGFDVSLTFTFKATTDTPYRKAYYGAADGAAASQDHEESQVTILINNGGTTTAEREISIDITKLAYEAIPLTGISGEGDVYMYSASGIAIKSGASNLVDFVIKNANETAYDGA